MSVKETMTALLQTHGTAILKPDQRQTLIGILAEQNACTPQMQRFLLCLSCVSSESLSGMQEMPLTVYQNLLRSCVTDTGLQYGECAENLSLLLELLQIRVGGVSDAAKRILPETKQPEAEHYFSLSETEDLLQRAEAVSAADQNEAKSLYAELMRADVTEAFYRYGTLTVPDADAQTSKRGVQSLLTAASRGHIPAALFLGDYYMSVGNYAQARRCYCGFGGAVLNEERRGNVYLLDRMKRNNLRMMIAGAVFAALGILCTVLLGKVLQVSAPAFRFGVSAASFSAVFALFGLLRFLQNPLYRARHWFFGEVLCFLCAVCILTAGTGVIV